MSEETGMSILFSAIGTEAMTRKIQNTSNALKSLDRKSKALSFVGKGLAKVGQVNLFGHLPGQLSQFAFYIQSLRHIIRNNADLVRDSSIARKFEIRRLASQRRMISRRKSIGSVLVGTKIGSTIATKVANSRLIRRGKEVSGKVKSRVGAAIDAGTAAFLLRSGQVAEKLGSLVGKLGLITTSAIALSATFIAVSVAAFFKLDKKLASAIRQINLHVVKPAMKNISDFFVGFKDGWARLVNRGEWISDAFSKKELERRISPTDRRSFEQQVTDDLTAMDREEAIDSQLQEIRDKWKAMDEKMETELNRIVENMRFSDRR